MMNPGSCMAAWLCLPWGAAGAAGGATPPSHCAAPAQTSFACPTTGGRVVALCRDADDAVVYRFGRIGVVELQYPPSAQPHAGRMLYAQYSRYGTDRVEVRFGEQGTEYTVFDYREDGVRRAGVRLASSGGRQREIACHAPITGHLGGLKNRLPCDTDSALNLGTCR